MVEPPKEKIKIALPSDVNINEESHEKRYEQKYEQSYDPHDSNVRLSYDILRIIFQYLNYKDLSSAMMVCRFWSEVANDEKSSRGPHCFIKPCWFMEQRRFDYIKQSTIKPSIGFFFIPVFAAPDYEFSDSTRDLICEMLSKNCKAIILFTRFPILNKIRTTFEGNIVYALFPQISNVKISTVEVINGSQRRFEVGLEEYRKMIESYTPNHENSSCLMIFCNSEFGFVTARKLVKIAGNRSNNKNISSCWGGAMIKVHTNEGFIATTAQYCIAVLITGSIKTWSVILHGIETKEQMEQKLKLFKEQVNLQKHSVGFIISSDIRKWMTEYGETMFKNLFPKVPLVGCYSSFLCGKDFIDETITDYYVTKRWGGKFTTVIMILTYG